MKNERIVVSSRFWQFLILSFFFVFISFSTTFLVPVKATSGTYERYDVNININEDSTMDVEESVVTRWTGEFHYINRDLTLTNAATLAQCQANSALQCGGFSYVKIIGVYDENGKQVPDSQLNTTSSTSSGNTYLTVKWTFSSGGRQFNDEQFKYKIKYKVFGGLGYFDTYDLFYWNMLPSSRPSEILSSSMKITFPKKITYSKDNLRVLTNYLIKPSSLFDTNTNTININAQRIPVGNDFTVMYKFPKDIIKKYGGINITSDPDPIDVEVNGILVEGVSKSLTGIPPGSVNLVFSKSGYDSKTMSIALDPGEMESVSITLEKALWMKVLEVLNIAGTCFGCLTIPLGLFLIYFRWYKKGRDKANLQTIVPEYSPPDNLPSYLVGSLKDEKVDLTDITSSIIDLAYRGYLKIREFTTGKILGFGGSKDYEFTKLKTSEGLTEAEQELLDGIFSSSEKVNISDLKYKFYKHIPTIERNIYNEMLDKDFFKERPDKVRSKYLGWGTALVTISLIGAFFVGPFIFVIAPFTLALAVSMFINGIALIIFSNFMPAKTEKGYEIFRRIKGFRMYMHTAERFRVQDLTPETFEKYLSYAICFKIESKWADRFKDIYKKAPEWFETDSINTFSTLYFLNSLSSFSAVSATALATSRSSSSSSSGGGWSGGGGFSGGFSGGGGGGGGSGWG